MIDETIINQFNLWFEQFCSENNSVSNHYKFNAEYVRKNFPLMTDDLLHAYNSGWLACKQFYHIMED